MPVVEPFSPEGQRVLTGHREESFRVDVLTLRDAKVTELDGVEGGAFDYSIYRTIRSGGSLTVTTEAPPDWLRVRLRPWYIARQGDLTVEWPLGTFIPATPDADHADDGQTYAVDLYDKLLVLDEDAVENTYTLDAGTVVTDAVRALILETGETAMVIAESPETLTSSLVWEAGTTRLRIVNDLLDSINYFALWCDGYGRYHAEPYVPAGARPIVWPFADDERGIYLPEFRHGRDLFSVPNKVVAVQATGGETEALVASVAAPPDWPTSFENRGRYIVHTETDVEATSYEVLAAYAERRLRELSNPASTASIEFAPLPLNLNDVVSFTRDARGVRLPRATVSSFSVPFGEPGGLMRAELTEVIS